MAYNRVTVPPAKRPAPAIETDAKKAKSSTVTEHILQQLQTEIQITRQNQERLVSTADPYTASLIAWLNTPLSPDPEEDDMFAEFEDVDFKPPSKTDWKDKELTNLKCYRMSYLEDDDIITIGKSFMSSLHIEMKDNVLAEMFLLAFNLRDRLSDRIIDNVELSLLNLADQQAHNEITGYPREIVGGRLPVTSIGHTTSADQKRRLAIAYSYLAASYIRLFTKPAENYLRSGNILETQFERFYSFKIPLIGFHPKIDAIQYLKNRVEGTVRARDTLYVFLYSANRCTKGKNIKDFLYSNHIIYTGLHPLTLFLKAMEMHNKSCAELASVLDTPKVHDTLRSLLSVIKRFIESGSTEYAVGMWKYARLFDQNFLNDVCTKYCIHFTLVMAFLTRDPNAPPHQDVFNIAQLKNASDFVRDLAREHAFIAVQCLSQNIIPDRTEGWSQL